MIRVYYWEVTKVLNLEGIETGVTMLNESPNQILANDGCGWSTWYTIEGQMVELCEDRDGWIFEQLRESKTVPPKKAAMATKKQLTKRLAEIHPEAQLEESDSEIYWDIEMVAPPGHHWNEGPHALVLCWNRFPGEKPLFWREALDRLEDAFVIPCDSEESICEHHPRRCGFWCDSSPNA